MQRVKNKFGLDKDKKQIVANFSDIPEKLIWYGDNICYFTKNKKLNFIFIKGKDDKTELVENVPDLDVTNIELIQTFWFVIDQAGCGMFFELDGQPATKAMIIFNPDDPLIDLGVFNDLYIVALYSKSINIFDINDGQMVQDLNIDTNSSQKFIKKFLSRGNNRIFVVSTTKKR